MTACSRDGDDASPARLVMQWRRPPKKQPAARPITMPPIPRRQMKERRKCKPPPTPSACLWPRRVARALQMSTKGGKLGMVPSRLPTPHASRHNCSPRHPTTATQRRHIATPWPRCRVPFSVAAVHFMISVSSSPRAVSLVTSLSISQCHAGSQEDR